MTERDIVVFDLDETLADCSHREHLIPDKSLRATASNWDRFSLACGNDQPITANILLLVALSHQYRIFILTSRGDVAYAETVHWLARHNIPYDRLLMRGERENRPPADIKIDWLNSIDPGRVLCAFDDNPLVCSAIRSIGVTCHQVTDHGIDHV